MTKRNYSSTARPIPMTAGVSDTGVTLSFSSAAGYPAPPFLIAVDRGTPSEEVMLVTAKTATQFTVTRGYDGTAASAHAIGAIIEHTTSAIDFRESALTPMTTAERNALSGTNLYEGLVIANSDTDTLDIYDGAQWVAHVKVTDTRLTDARTPVAHSHAEADVTSLVADLASKAPTSRIITAGTGLSGGGDLSANRSLAVVYGSAAGTAAQGNDGRLSDARTPLAHSHAIADLPVAGDGSSSSTALVRANDSRLSNSRPPNAHSHPKSDIYDLGSIGSAAAQNIGTGYSDLSLNGQLLKTTKASRATNLNANSGSSTPIIFNAYTIDQNSAYAYGSSNLHIPAGTSLISVWLIVANIEFESNSSGRRTAFIVCGSDEVAKESTNAVAGSTTNLSLTAIVNAGNTDVHVSAFHNAGVSLSVGGDLTIVKLSPM